MTTPSTLMSADANRRLSKQTAIVTGASSGVGLEIALALAREGVNPILVGRRLDALRQVAQKCTEIGVKAHVHQVDLLNDREVRAFCKTASADSRGIDILIHSAGVIKPSRLEKASLDDFDLQYKANVRAPFFLTQLLLPALVTRKGQIVFINSTAGLVAGAGISQYAATKHALKALADSWRDELNPLGVRILSVYLGRTATPMQADVHRWEGKAYAPAELIQPCQVARTVVDALALGREAEVMDIRIRPMAGPPQHRRGS